MLNASLKGHSNPEFIGDGHDDDNDIYKAQLLLFLKQSHLTRPNVFQDVQDNKTDQSESPRKMSALSTTSEKKDEKTGATEETKVADIEKSSPKVSCRIRPVASMRQSKAPASVIFAFFLLTMQDSGVVFKSKTS